MQLQNIDQCHATAEHVDLAEKLTIVFPVRIDCDERKSNLSTVIRHIRPMGCRVIVLEADKAPLLEGEQWLDEVEYIFREDRNAVFHRTKYINILLNMAETEAVAVWDTDVMVALDNVSQCVGYLSSGSTITYPYNGEYVILGSGISVQVRKNPDISDLAQRKLKPIFNRPFCGGIYIVHRLRYLACGGENENFTGWGPEDAERLRRVRNLGHDVRWTMEGQAYHLWHPRGGNSWFFDREAESRLKLEMVKVSSMTREELSDYITSEIWNITRN